MKKKILILLLTLNTILVYSQLSINATLTPTYIIQSTLIGSGITATNITFNGSSASALNVRDQVGIFSNGQTTNLGMANGIIIATGKANLAIGPNNQNDDSSQTSFPIVGDPDLAQLVTYAIANKAVIEFDFISTNEIIGLDFIFASEEYPEFVNSIFNDVMGIFLSGPGIVGPFSNNAKNIAVLPLSSIPVITNTINNGLSNNGPCESCNYYVDNGTGNTPLVNATLQYDGFTTEIDATSAVQTGLSYHLKIAIANVYDNLYDSAIFLKANSFNSSTLKSQSFNQSKITIFPNPAKNKVQINLKDNFDTIEEITLFSMLGTQNNLSFKTSANETSIDLSYLSKGLYFIEINTKKKSRFIQKLVID